MTTNNSILVANVPSNKSNNMVWAVFAQGNEQEKSCPDITILRHSGSILSTTNRLILSLESCPRYG